MGFFRDRIVNHVMDKKERLHNKVLLKLESVKLELRKKFTIAGLFILGILLILQGLNKLFLKFLDIPEYIGFFVLGGILIIAGTIYYLINRKSKKWI